MLKHGETGCFSATGESYRWANGLDQWGRTENGINDDPGGRLVIVESWSTVRTRRDSRMEMQHHELPSSLVDDELRQNGFEIVNRQDDFISLPGDQIAVAVEQAVYRVEI